MARTGPISAMRAKKRTNATAVQTTPSVTTEAITRVVGWLSPSWMIPTGAYTSAAQASDAATTPTDGRCDSLREMIIGPTA